VYICFLIIIFFVCCTTCK